MSVRIELLKRYLQEDPSDSFLRYALALEFIGLNNHEEALIQLEKLLNDDSDYLAGYYIAGKSAEAINKNETAIAFYEKGIEVARSQKNLHTMNELEAALNNLMD